MEYDFKNVARWSKRKKGWPSLKLSGLHTSFFILTHLLQVDTFSQARLIFPLNHGNMHWALGVVNFTDKTFEYYDSMESMQDKGHE